MSYIYPFRMASGTATMLLIDPIEREVIIGVRNSNAWVYPGADSLPGGFMEARWTEEQDQKLNGECARVREALSAKLMAAEFHEGENLEMCAIREIKEELGIDVDESQLNMFTVRSNSRTDTRAHVINACYYVELTPEQVAGLKAGDDLEAIKKQPIDDLFLELPNIEAMYPMAFNHFEIMMQGLLAWNKDKNYERLVQLERQLRADGVI